MTYSFMEKKYYIYSEKDRIGETEDYLEALKMFRSYQNKNERIM